MYNILLLLLLLMSVTLVAEDSISVDQVKSKYREIYFAEMSVMPDNGFVVNRFGVRSPDSTAILAKMINTDVGFFEYLIQNSVSLTLEEKRELWKDSLKFEDRFFDHLEKDSLFNSAFLSVTNRFLESKGHNLIGFTRDSPYNSYTWDDVMYLAVRFFYPNAVIDGWISSHVCVGINGLKDFPRQRNPVIEAFVFSAIFKNLDNPDYDLRGRWQAASDLMNNLGLSSEDTVALHRAQGVMWGYMAQSEDLRKVLETEYDRMSIMLPFEIVESR